jgi:predicted nucleic acid-binding Zn ribbon protein
MRCQRCGFEIEVGQTFCSMCGTEVAKAERPKKRKIKSIFWAIKVASKQHLKMWINFFLLLAVMFYVIFGMKGSPAQVAYLCMCVLLLMYVLFECLLPYKNPNASKNKAYKLGIRVSFMMIVLLAVIILFTGDITLLDLVKRL